MKIRNRLISFALVMNLLLSFPGEMALASGAEPASEDPSLRIVEMSGTGETDGLVPGEESPDQGEDPALTIGEPENSPSAEPAGTPESGEEQKLGDPDPTATVEEPADEGESAEEPEESEEPEGPEEPEDSGETEDAPGEIQWRTIQAQLDRTPLFDDKEEPAQELRSAWGFWHALLGREPAVSEKLSRESIPAAVEVSGLLPPDVTAEIRLIEFAEREVYSENALFTFALTLLDGEGNPFRPEGEITIHISGDTVGRSLGENRPVLVYIYNNNTERAETMEADFAADVLVYRSDFGNSERLAYDTEAPGAVRFTESQEGLTVHGDRSFEFNCSADGTEPVIFALSDQLLERFVQGSSEEGTAVAVFGPLSENVTAEISSNADASAAEDTLLALDINLSHSQTEDYQPDSQLAVLIQDRAIGEKRDDGAELTLWSVDAEGETQQVEDALFQGDVVFFNTSALATYVITYDLHTYYKDAEGETWKISASYGSDTGIPGTAALAVSELLEGTPEYENYVNQTAAALGVAPEKVILAKAFDIALIDPETGDEYQTDGSVKISIELMDADLAGNQDLNVVHFAGEEEQAQVVDSAVNGETVEFVTDGFSVFVVMGYTVDFHWNGFEYNLDGGGEIFLGELIQALGIEEFRVEDVENVSFSDPSLVQVEEVVVFGPEAEDYVEDENKGDEEIELPDAVMDWRLLSLAPFDTDEILTIDLKDGSSVTIDVTDAAVPGTRVANARVTAEGVTYNLQNNGTANGWARVYAYSNGCMIHDQILYNGRTYTVQWANTGVGYNNFTRFTKIRMDAELIRRAAGYSFDLPEMKTSVPQEEQDAWGSGYVAGVNNDSSDYQIWKKAEYNPATNSIDYTMKIFQALKENVPLDFIFIYDDSISMFDGNRWAPSNANQQVRIVEAQGTRVIILEAAKALLSDAAKTGYDIRVAVGGAANGDTGHSGWFSARDDVDAIGGYDDLEEYMATYHGGPGGRGGGVTDHAVGANNAYEMAKDSHDNVRIPIVIYLSDFVDGGGTAAFRQSVTPKMNQVHKWGSVYGLKTIGLGDNFRTDAICSGGDYLYFMRDEFPEGVKQLEIIIKDAIGFYMKNKVTVTDNLSEALTDYLPQGAAAEEGSAVAAQGKTTWTIGGTSPYPGSGTVYTETFSVKLKDDTVYAGSMPTNGAAEAKVGGEMVNSINPSDAVPDKLHYGGDLTIVLAHLNDKGKTLVDTTTGEPLSNALVSDGSISFTLTKQGESAPIATYSTANGQFTIPYKTGTGDSAAVTLQRGQTYVLQEVESSVNTYNEAASRNPANLTDPQLVMPDQAWLLKVSPEGIVTISVNGTANQTPEATIWKGGPAKYVLWNQIVVPATLIQITVQKTWNSNEHLVPVPFYVYGIPMTVDTDGTITYGEQTEDPLPAYSEKNVASAQVQYLTEADYDADASAEAGKTVWSRKVWVPDKLSEEEKFYDYDTVSREELQMVVNQGHSLKTDPNSSTSYTPDQILDLMGTEIDGVKVLVCSQKYSYVVDEGDLVFEDGWYTPESSSSTDTGYVGDWTTATAGSRAWVAYDGETSTQFKLHLNFTNLYFGSSNRTEVSNFRSWFDGTLVLPVGSDYYTHVNNRARLRNLYNNLYSVTIGIRDTADGNQMYRLTLYPGSSYTPAVAYDYNYGVDFTGISLPIKMEGYSATATYKRLSALKITYIGINAKGHTSDANTFVIYGTDPENSAKTQSIRTFMYDSCSPDSATDYRRTEIELISGTRGSTARNNNTSRNAVSGSSLRYYKYTPPVPSKEDGKYLIHAFTLELENTWLPNALKELRVVKNWKLKDGETVLAYAVDEHNAKQDITFSLNGVTPTGGPNPVPIFASVDDPWSAGTRTYTIPRTDENKDQAQWIATVYVPTYDTSTYDRSKSPVCEKYTYRTDEVDLTAAEKTAIEENFTENPLTVSQDADGQPKGEWSSGKEFTGPIFDEQDPVYGDPYWTSYTPASQTQKYVILSLDPGDDTVRYTNLSGLRFSYTVGDDQFRQEITFNNVNTGYFNAEKNYYIRINVDSGLLGEGAEIGEAELRIGTQWQKDELSVECGVTIQDSSQGTSISGGLSSQYEKETRDVLDPGYSNTAPATFTLTNTYIPYKAVTLTSVFNDESDDRESTGSIGSVIYTIEGVKANGETYSRSVTTTAAPSETGSSDTKTVRSFTKTVYVPAGTYTITESAYTVSGDPILPVAYSVKNQVNTDAAQDGAARENHSLTVDSTVTFTNERKKLPVRVLIDWEPSLGAGEDPLEDSGKTIEYKLSYYNAHSGSDEELKNGSYTQTLNGSSVSMNGDYGLSKAAHINDHTGIPTYSVTGVMTDCFITGDSLTEILPDYDTEVEQTEEADRLVFTLKAYIKRAKIQVDKRFSEDFLFDEYKGARLTYTITRSDGKNIYGVNGSGEEAKSVTMVLTVPDNESEMTEILSGVFDLNGKRGSLDPKTQTAYEPEETIYLPILRSYPSSGETQVKYILTETVEKEGIPEYFYYPNFTDANSDPDNQFAQTNPRGRNDRDTDKDGVQNKARFRLTGNGILVLITNANAPYICKIVETFNGTQVEKPFRYLNAAVKYARENLIMDADHPITIQMLLDYTIPGDDSAAPGTTPAQWKTNDRVVLGQNTLSIDGESVTVSDNFIFTTAATSGGVYNFVDTQDGKAASDKGTAILTRGFDGADLFTVDHASGKLAFRDIIFDGKEGATQHTGRVVYVSAGSLTVNGGSTFRNLSITGNDNEGGAIFSRADVTIRTGTGETVTFSNCSSESEGGAISLAEKKLTIANAGTLRFDNCSGTYGGAICTDTAGEMAVTNSGSLSFKNCSATSNGGGAIWTGIFKAEDNSGSISFTNCTAKGQGGAIVANRELSTSDTFMLTNTATGTASFTNCTAGTNGGAVYVNKGKCTITSADASKPITFEGCAANGTSGNGKGGAVYQDGGDAMTLENVTFGVDGDAAKACKAGTNGGAVYTAATSTVELTNVKAYGKGSGTNTATNGGAIFVENAALTMNGGEFKDLAASASGGAIYVDNAALTVSGSEFKGLAGSDGGAICQNGGATMTLTNVAFGEAGAESKGCTAAANDGKGGAVYTAADAATLTDCSFYYGKTTGGNSEGGGAIYYSQDNGSLSLYGCVFDHCQASGSGVGRGNGGAVQFNAGSTFTVDQSTARRSSFTDCTANRFGGAVEHEPDGGTLTVGNTDFTRCLSSTTSGGAIGTDSETATVENCSFTGCTAISSSGGAIASGLDNTAPEITLTNTTITGCSARSGAAVYSKGDLTIQQSGTGKSEIKNCTASQANGGAVNVVSSRIFFEGDVVVYGNTNNGNPANVVLNQNNNTTINTTTTGLGANAHVGVYVTGTVSGNPYKEHGTLGLPFGTRAGGATATDKNLNRFTNDRDETLFGVDSTDAGKTTADDLIYWGHFICKIVDSDGNEWVFPTLSKAVTHARTNGNGTAMSTSNPVKIQMLVDYEIPSIDKLTLDQASDNIIITTAKTQAKLPAGEKYYFAPTFTAAEGRLGTDSGETAILKRGYTGESLFTVGHASAGLSFQSILLDGAKTTFTCSGNGGLAKATAGTLTVDSGAALRNSAAENGGAVYVDANAVMTMTGGTITGNTASTAGAGICLSLGSTLNLSGTLSFSDNTVEKSGYSTKMNGLSSYGSDNVRQDIYLPEEGAESTSASNYDPASIILTGDITAADGSIWVWAENQYRYKQLMPFAKASGVEFVETAKVDAANRKFDAAHLRAFRNAQDDEITENGTDAYLFGSIEGEKENAGLIYWSGSSGYRKVILRKVDENFTALKDREFTIYKGSSASAYTLKGETTPLSELKSGFSGCFWIGNLPYGTYIVEETEPHRFFYLIVDDSGTFGTLVGTDLDQDKVGGFETRAAAENAAKTKYEAIKEAKKTPATP